MALTYEPILTTSISAQTSFSISSFSGYTDLVIILVGTTDNGNSCYVRFNGDTSAVYSKTSIQGNGASRASYTDITQTYINLYAGFGMTQPSMYRLNLFSYGYTAGSKTMISEGSTDANGSGIINRLCGQWRNTSAISSVSFTVFSGTFTGTVYVYGILAA